jgi:hypothetical protein
MAIYGYGYGYTVAIKRLRSIPMVQGAAPTG